MAVMVPQVVCIMLLSYTALSGSLSCGSLRCSQDYSPSCPPDKSAYLYDHCMTPKSKCDKPIGPAANLSVDCYDTCVVSIPYAGIPLRTCADSINEPNVMSVTKDAKSNVIVEIHPPPLGSNFYQLNRFCKYNIQCPNETYMLHYSVICFDIEPPDAVGQCLDFLRIHFSATGMNKCCNLCGKLSGPRHGGFHGSKLILDFRSNRIYNKGDFNLGIVCIPSSAMAQKNSGYGNRYSVQDCSSSQTLRSKRSADRPTTAKEFFDMIFPASALLTNRYDIIVTREDVVKYSNQVVVVEHKGRIIRLFRWIKKLQVHNRIEGYLNFFGSSSPPGRTFPGHGFLRVGRTGIAQYVQTIVDPIYLLTDEEEETVRKLFKEHYNRKKLKNYYSNSRLSEICGIYRLAEQNTASCSMVVRAVANFFLEAYPHPDFCYPSIR